MKLFYICVGFLALGLGSIGIILPILPTTPFLLVASFCFVRGSDKFHNWFKSTRIYRKHLESFVTKRSMPLKTKIFILAFASSMLIIAFLMVDVIYARIVILGVIVYKYYYFITKIKTEKD